MDRTRLKLPESSRRLHQRPALIESHLEASTSITTLRVAMRDKCLAVSRMLSNSYINAACPVVNMSSLHQKQTSRQQASNKASDSSSLQSSL
jgi:hypothetical protein